MHWLQETLRPLCRVSNTSKNKVEYVTDGTQKQVFSNIMNSLTKLSGPGDLFLLSVLIPHRNEPSFLDQFILEFRPILSGSARCQGPRYRGIQGGPWPPSKIFSSCCSKSLFFYYFSISEYQIGNPCSCVYLVQFLPFIRV